MRNWKPGREIALLIGPEGDLTAEEWISLQEAGFHGVHMGHTTFRVETAALALLAGVTVICDEIMA